MTDDAAAVQELDEDVTVWAKGPPTVVRYGNSNPQMTRTEPDGKRVQYPAEHLNQTVTTAWIPAGTLDPEKVALSLSTNNDRLLTAISRILPDEDRSRFALAVYEAEQVLAVHAAGQKPDWVDCPQNPDLAKCLATYFECAAGEPTNVLTEGGRDALHEQHLKGSAQPAGFEWGALTKYATTPVATKTKLEEEITTSEGGLIREKMTFAHSAGTNTSTLTHTWTANVHDSLPITIAQWANFNKTKELGTMGEYDALSSTATLSASGDSITVTFTLTAG
jgi:hypothetical protein